MGREVWLQQIELRTSASIKHMSTRPNVFCPLAVPCLRTEQFRNSPSLRFPPWSQVRLGWQLFFPTSPYLRWHGAVKWSEGSNDSLSVNCRLSFLKKKSNTALVLNYFSSRKNLNNDNVRQHELLPPWTRFFNTYRMIEEAKRQANIASPPYGQASSC